ncbi:MAG TPA: pitrilysin family protein [Polyangiaceae bacterium]|jgi:predicted Zn-dependent peptidase|nr:pitrilysin family protein [Polyangiaceae bacterium]
MSAAPAKKRGPLAYLGRALAVACGVSLAIGCGEAATVEVSSPAKKVGPDDAKRAGGNTSQAKGGAAVDSLGSKPTLPKPETFTPPPPDVYPGIAGSKVWLAERHTLPVISVMIAIPKGSAADPPRKPGLAYITADMLDEGAGARGAVEISSAINDLGASIHVDVTADGSYATLTVLKKNFDQAFAILGDILARPRFDPKEWKRVSDLWRSGLVKRADDPADVSRVVSAAASYGPTSPYGHPPEGLLRGANAIGLPDVKAFYASVWRPDQATIVIAGDISKAEATKSIAAALGGWKAPAEPASAPITPEGPAPKWTPPRLVIVDRPDAPQSVIAAVRAGVSASSPSAPLLELINTALGGSFTSRLNQNLREDHGWSYGARSAFTETRGRGVFVARAAVHTEATGPALKELYNELAKMSASGLTQDELMKVLAQDRGELVQAYETVQGVSARLGRLALLGLPPTFDAQASRARQQATMKQIADLAVAVDPKDATVVVVGPKAQVEPQLKPLGLGEAELWDPEGNRIGAGAASK